MNYNISFKKKLHRLFYLLKVSQTICKVSRNIRIIMYHGIGDNINSEAFDSHLKFFQRYFNIIDINRVAEIIANPSLGSGRELVLTFDDGLMNNYEVALPLLKYYKIPATFYVCPDLIDSGKWLWTHDIRCRLKFLSEDSFIYINKLFDVKFEDHSFFVDWMKTLDLLTRKQVENAVREVSTDFCPTEAQHKLFDIMTWDQISMLDPDLITIGSHTASHPILNSLDPESMINEIKGSRIKLEAQLGRPIENFCFPNGNFSDEVLGIVRENYKTAVTVVQQCVSLSSDSHLLPRVPAAENIDLMAWRLWRPSS